MTKILLLISVFWPVAAGIVLYLAHLRERRKLLCGLSLGIILPAAAAALYLVFSGAEAEVELIRFSDALVLVLRPDGLGRIFGLVAAVLWPLTALYAFAYMKEENYLSMFFSFFTQAFGITLGIAFAGNLFTMYCFYELLTLVTVPLVLQPMNREASRASQTYLLFSLGGAAFAFVAMMFLLSHGGTGLFTLGGLTLTLEEDDIPLFCYFLGFLGFGVKSAVFPLHVWLPKASVAPTPVTALLHAVAVVKAGVFAVIRLTWYCFGPELLAGSWAQTAALCLVIVTVVFGSWMAVRETNWKRRLAYSTVSNLSYILFGALLLTESGLAAGLVHLLNHSCIKILAFFCAGAVLCRAGVRRVDELDGLGRRMPLTAACFTAASAALCGIPPFGGFVSKWQLLSAASELGTPLAYAGAFALILSAILTAIYMFQAAARLLFPSKSGEAAAAERFASVREASPLMTVPMLLLALGTLLLGLFGQNVLDAVLASLTAV